MKYLRLWLYYNTIVIEPDSVKLASGEIIRHGRNRILYFTARCNKFKHFYVEPIDKTSVILYYNIAAVENGACGCIRYETIIGKITHLNKQ